ncbi:cyclic AMP response element-binding protein A [Phymastichus coffea]|uniref:cyclic AMP response element-binding protein A n=1 Tax=Phymastichus coffea TaxID=108790 RepID=UPI00273CE657|nr:cyclic AMP response element-binding protein A [Phymastichus coffea]XP_058798700.1 cyclic AMP response element-binding protein A [Phymastichus coffea]
MMEYYDAGTSDLKELWGDYSYFVDTSLGQDVLMCKEDDWIMGLRDKSSCGGVVLRDRLMTDAALGGPKPIKNEHSYSLLASSPPRTNVESNGPAVRVQKIKQPHHQIVCSTSETSRIDVTDMEEECFPAISMNTASGRDSLRSTPEPFHTTECNVRQQEERETADAAGDEETNEATTVVNCSAVKGEPLSAPCSPCASDPAMLLEEKNTVAISPHSIHLAAFANSQSSDSEEDEEEMPMEFKVEDYHVMGCEDDAVDQTSNQELPPTPPSSASSDSEGTVSASCSPERRDSHGSVHVQNLRGFLQPRLYVTASGTIGQHATSTRQPIHTPLISCQPKGSTGILVLTEEEKRTLIAEGYPVPTKLPLTKQEEKSLKKVRRKIKNKISAQESRRKKKEYMDGLERRVTLLTNENSTYREKLSTLENTNRQLMKELQRLQALIQRK